MGEASAQIYSENGTEIVPSWHYLLICPAGGAL
jgi:hypothetical protein